MANGARGDARRFAAAPHAAAAAQGAHQHRRRKQQQHLARLHALNDVVSVATRRVFQSPSSLSELHAVRQHLPELCAFVDTLFQSSDGADTSAVQTQCGDAAVMRSVFRDPGAQWLSRSAMESGVTVLLCGQLLQCADERFAASGDVAPAQLVLLLLCDQLFTPCSVRLGAASRNCEWRDRKPAYHAMPCSSTWDALFPFLDRMAKRFPRVTQDILATYATDASRAGDAMTVSAAAKTPRVNCAFARVVGLWRLMESLGGAAHALSAPVAPIASTGESAEATAMALLDAVLQFLARTNVLEAIACSSVDAQSTTSRQSEAGSCASDVLFADLLMDKFFGGLQDFLFSCARSKRIARQALECVVVDAVMRLKTGGASHSCCATHQGTSDRESAVGVSPASLAVFTAVSCVFVNGLAHRVVSRLLAAQHRLNDSSSSSSVDRTDSLRFLVGLCAHVDLVPIAAVFDILSELLDVYAANASDRSARTHTLLCIVYIAVYRTDAVRALRQRLPSNDSSILEADDFGVEALEPHAQLLDFQDRLTRDVASQDFYAMPLGWMSLVWREWLAFSDDDIASFVASYDDDDELSSQTNSLDQLQATAAGAGSREHTAVPLAVESLAQALVFRDIDVVFARQRHRLGAHVIPSSYPLQLLASDDSSDLKQPSVRSLVESRRAVKKRRVAVDVDVEACKLSVLLLPDVMERVCSFMSAKRLCRLALVCRDFATISRSHRLWCDLFHALAARDLDTRECRHDAAYTHDWRAMYQLRWHARRRLRKKQRAASVRRERALLRGPDDDDADGRERSVSPSTAAAFVPRLCHVCGCNCVLASAAQLETHMKTHAQFACAWVCSDGVTLCTAAFGSLAQLKKHRASVHGERIERPARVEKPRMACGFPGCSLSYTSLKRLESHRALKNHHVATDASASNAEANGGDAAS